MKTGIMYAAALAGLFIAQATAADQKPTGSATIAGSPIRMPAYHVRADVPTAIHIVEPKLQTDYAGVQVEMKFTVDKEGNAYNIGVPNQNVDPNLAVQLTAMLRLWKFDPARDAQNNPIERTVILPVIIDEPNGTAPRVLNQPTAVAKVDATATTGGLVKMNPYHVRADVPSAVDVIVPRISTTYSGRTVELKFIVDQTGHPYNVQATDLSVDPSLVTQLWSAVGSWRFDPARNAAGTAIERSVILPITID